MDPASNDPELNAVLGANARLSGPDRQALAAAVEGIGALWPRIVEHQRQHMGEFAEMAATRITAYARQALRLAAELPSLDAAAADLANGEIAFRLTRDGFDATIPGDAACHAGCFFCCVVVNRISATEAEITRVNQALDGLPEPGFHPDACPSLDPETRACRAYAVRPLVCRDVFANEAGPCRESYEMGAISPQARFVKAGGLTIFYATNWLLIALGRPELLRTYDLKASLRAGGQFVPLPD